MTEEVPTQISAFRVRRPNNVYLPAAWRDAISEINVLLAQPDSPLALGFAAAYREDGNLAAKARLREVVSQHEHLFPGEVGWHVAWQTLTGGHLSVWTLGETIWDAVNWFERDTPTPTPRRGRRAHVQKRKHGGAADVRINKLLADLTGNGDPHTHKKPKMYAEARTNRDGSKEFTGKEFNRWLSRLRKKQDIDIRPSGRGVERWSHEWFGTQEGFVECLAETRVLPEQSVKRGCLKCGTWEFWGTLEEGSAAFAAHRAECPGAAAAA